MPTKDDFTMTPTSQLSTQQAAAQAQQQGGIGSVKVTPPMAQQSLGAKSTPSSGMQGADVHRKTQGWWSGMNQSGIQNSAYDPGSFFRNFGQFGAGAGGGGWEPGGSLEGFFSSTFNPRDTAATQFMDPSKYSDPEDMIAGQSAVMEGLMNNGVILDPSVIVGNTMKALTSVKSITDLAKINPTLAAILNAAATNPDAQVQALTKFLSSALAGAMPPDVLSSWITTIQRIGSGFMNQMDAMDLKGGGKAKFDMASFANYLTSALGPTLGL